jgi:hypothetical protein
MAQRAKQSQKQLNNSSFERMQKHYARKESSGRAWKIISIIFIVIFALVVIGGLLKSYHFHESMHAATQQQVDAARTMAIADLKGRGEDLTNFTWRASDFVRKAPVMGNNSRDEIIEVTLNNQTVRHSYLIDITAGKIIMYARTEFPSGMPSPKNGSMPPGGPGDDGPGRDRLLFGGLFR